MANLKIFYICETENNCMKGIKKYFVVAAILLYGSVNAQILNESFSITFPPSGWVKFLNNVAGIPFFNEWTSVTVNIPPSATDYAAFAAGQGPGSTIFSEKYLVTPSLKPIPGKDTLSFSLKRSGPVPLYGKYLVKVSTASNNQAADFTTVATFSEGFTTGVTTTFQTFKVNLSAYNYQNIYVAFVWTGNGDNSCYVDDVTGITLNEGVVPLKLINFSATAQNSKVLLTWEVAETTLKLFTIETSTDGYNWKEISKVSSVSKQYSFDHINASRGRNYYRLAQMQLNGKIMYSPIRSVVMGNNEIEKMASCYPNPAIDQLTIDLGYIPSKRLQYYLVDKSGKRMATGVLSARQETLEISKLPSGSYLLKLSDGQVLKWVKSASY